MLPISQVRDLRLEVMWCALGDRAYHWLSLDSDTRRVTPESMPWVAILTSQKKCCFLPSVPGNLDSLNGLSSQTEWKPVPEVPSKCVLGRDRHAWLAIAVVQLISHAWILVTPWTAARQASCPLLSPFNSSMEWMSTSTFPLATGLDSYIFYNSHLGQESIMKLSPMTNFLTVQKLLAEKVFVLNTQFLA